MNRDLRYGRMFATPHRAREHAADAHRFLDKSVLLRADAPALETANGRTIFRTSVRLLIRCCPKLVVAVDDATLQPEAKSILEEADGGGRVIAASEADSQSFDAVLSIGPLVENGLLDTAAWSDGWRAQEAWSGSVAWGLT